VVHGIATLPPIAAKRQKLNSGDEPLSRAGELMRLPKGPSHVKRIGHGVLMTPKFQETVGWFRETLGFVCSDDVYAGERDNLIGSFNRCDRGDAYVDHHVFFCLNHAKTGLNHLSFEVADIDDVAMGLGHRPARAGQPGLRLLGRPLGPRARALGRQRPAQSRQRLKPGAGGRGAGLAMGRGAAGEVHRSRQPVTALVPAPGHDRTSAPAWIRKFYGALGRRRMRAA
jgi:hypothetical protein